MPRIYYTLNNANVFINNVAVSPTDNKKLFLARGLGDSNVDGGLWISTNGGMTRANGDRFRKYILSVGNSVDLNQAYKDFTGRTPDIKPLLKNKGFIK